MTRNELINAERENGAKYTELAKKYNISPERVRQICFTTSRRLRGSFGSFYPDFEGYGTNGVRLCLALLRAGITTKEQIIELAKSGEIMKVSLIGEKYFRIICEVYKESLSEMLTEAT